MQTTGPRRYSKLELCTTRQLDNLAREFCYDLDTLRNIDAALGARTCLHSAYVRRSVERQVRALTAKPPRAGRAMRIMFYQLGVTAVLAVAVAAAFDQLSQWLG